MSTEIKLSTLSAGPLTIAKTDELTVLMGESKVVLRAVARTPVLKALFSKPEEPVAPMKIFACLRSQLVTDIDDESTFTGLDFGQVRSNLATIKNYFLERCSNSTDKKEVTTTINAFIAEIDSHEPKAPVVEEEPEEVDDSLLGKVTTLFVEPKVAAKKKLPAPQTSLGTLEEALARVELKLALTPMRQTAARKQLLDTQRELENRISQQTDRPKHLDQEAYIQDKAPAILEAFLKVAKLSDEDKEKYLGMTLAEQKTQLTVYKRNLETSQETLIESIATAQEEFDKISSPFTKAYTEKETEIANLEKLAKNNLVQIRTLTPLLDLLENHDPRMAAALEEEHRVLMASIKGLVPSEDVDDVPAEVEDPNTGTRAIARIIAKVVCLELVVPNVGRLFGFTGSVASIATGTVSGLFSLGAMNLAKIAVYIGPEIYENAKVKSLVNRARGLTT